MAYPSIQDDNFKDIINRKKEFAILSNVHRHTENSGIIPYFMLESELKKGNHIRLRSYQRFVRSFINPDTGYTRLLINAGMGTGKTISSIAVAMRFIDTIKRNPNSKSMVYVLGFTRAQFERDLMRFPEFGFITRDEIITMNKLAERAISSKSIKDITRHRDFRTLIKRRFGNKIGNGYFKFMGYGEVTNRIFGKTFGDDSIPISKIAEMIKSGELSINMEFINTFRHSMIICDEIHNTYNSTSQNNWGTAIQMILDELGNEVFMIALSGTVLKNSQVEIVDLCNFMTGSKNRKFKKADFFDDQNELIPGALSKISQAMKGRVSFLIDANPERYPSHTYEGEYLPSSDYVKFARCPMTKLQSDTYDTIEGKLDFAESPYIFDMVFPSPSKDGPPIYKSKDVLKIKMAPKSWKEKHMIQITENSEIVGDILNIDNISAYSNKYPRMLEMLDDIMKSGGSKVFIYHRFVRMTGVFLIKNILLANGFIDHNGDPNSKTKCVKCGISLENHANIKKHQHIPARFILIYGEMKKRDISMGVTTYNRKDNLDGSKIMIIIGSRVMREAFDLMATQHVMVISQPDNVPALTQIITRAIRSNSHVNLPPDQRWVKVNVFVASRQSGGSLTYEEARWVKKIKDYKVIQKIERTMHEAAVDASVNRHIIKPSLVENGVGHLAYDVSGEDISKKPLSELDITTYSIYNKNDEVYEISYIIKRLFGGHSQMWKKDDLFGMIRNPPFNVEYDCTKLSRDNMEIALYNLTWKKSDIMMNRMKSATDVSDLIFDPNDKRIYLFGTELATIVKIGEYYILFPIDEITGVPKISMVRPFRSSAIANPITINIDDTITARYTMINFDITMSKFKMKYDKKKLNEMENAICDFGTGFHIKLIERVVKYVFNVLYSKSKKSNENNDFYFKMLYYYDIFGVILWLDYVDGDIRKLYDNKSIKSKNDLELPKFVPQKYKEENRGRIIQMARSIESIGCAWCPKNTGLRYNKAVTAAKNRTTVVDSMIPVGYSLKKSLKFYHPDRDWFSYPKYGQHHQWKDNSIIVGFDEKTEGGIRTRFRIRKPKIKEKKYSDARLVHKGIICTSNLKSYLIKIANRLKVETNIKGLNTSELCKEIKARLMFLELTERAKGTNIKYFYNQFETFNI